MQPKKFFRKELKIFLCSFVPKEFLGIPKEFLQRKFRNKGRGAKTFLCENVPRNSFFFFGERGTQEQKGILGIPRNSYVPIGEERVPRNSCS